MKRIFFLVIILLGWMSSALGQVITTVSSTSENCFGSKDGTVKVDYTLTTTSVDIVLTTGELQGQSNNIDVHYVFENASGSSYTFTGIAAGTYQVRFRIRQNGNYIGSRDVTVGSQPPVEFPINGRPSKVDGVCGNDGTVKATVVGGNTDRTGYIMDIKNLDDQTIYSATALTNGVFEIDLPAGSYSIISITDDSKFCEINEDLSLLSPLEIIPSIGVKAIIVDKENVKCYGTATGKFALQIIEGNSSEYDFFLDYEYQGSSTEYFMFDKKPEEFPNGLPEGTYTYLVLGDNCSDRGNVIIEQPQSLVISSITPTDVTCVASDTPNGTITVTASEGTKPYLYKITGTVNRDWQSSNIFSNLPAGNYTVTVNDANNCGEVTGSTEIKSDPLSVLIMIDNEVLCKGAATGKAHAVVSGGISTGITYSWTGPDGFTNATSTIENLKAGSYTVEVNAGGCTVTDTKVITEPALSLTASITNTVKPSCNQNNGSITVTATGGTNPYQYSINGGINYQSSNSFSGLAANTYSISVKDANGCTFDVAPYELKSPKPIEFTLSPNPAQLNCPEDTKEITIQVTDGETGWIIEYQVNPNPSSWVEVNNTASFSRGADSWSVTLRYKDALYNDCTTTQTVDITAPEPLVLNPPTKEDVSCNNGSDGEIQVTASGGASGNNVTFHISGPNGYSSSNTTGLFTGLRAGNYTITMTNINGCAYLPLQRTITLDEPLPITNISLTADDVSCGGEETTLTVTANGDPNLTLAYSIDGENWQQENTFEVSAGPYVVRVGYWISATEAKCTVSKSITIDGRSAINIDYIDPPSPYKMENCDKTSVNFIVNVTIGDDEDKSNLRYNMGAGWQTSNEFLLTPSIVGYPLSVQYVDEPHCTVYGEIVKITTPVKIDIDVIFTDMLACPDSNDGEITIIATGNGDALEYSIGNGYFDNGGKFTGLSAGKYNVSARYKDNEDEKGCAQTWGEIEIKTPAAIVFTDVTPGTVTCATDPPTTLKITATGETGLVIEYSIDEGKSWPKQGYSGEEVIFDNIQSSTLYTVMARYRSIDCGIVTGPSITMPDPFAEIKYTITVDPFCADQTTTLMHIKATGEAGKPLEYMIGSVWYETGTKPVQEGNYFVSVRYKDSSCDANWQFIPIEKLAPIRNIAFTVDGVPLPCDDPQVKAKVTISHNPIPGNPRMNYIVSNGVNEQMSNTNIFQLPVGSYTVYMEYADNNACRQMSENQIIIRSNSPIGDLLLTTIDGENEKILDCGNFTTLKVSPQDADYRYSLNGGEEMTWDKLQAIEIKTGGSWSVEVWDINNPACKQTSNTVITIQPGQIVIDDSHVTVNQPQCFGETGSVIVAYPSHEALTYTLAPQTGPAITNNTGSFSDLRDGTYTLTVKYANSVFSNCTGNYDITIDKSPVNITGITLTPGVSKLDCSAATTTLTASATGSKPLEFRLDGGAWQTSVSGANINEYTYAFAGVGGGAHSVDVRYAGATCLWESRFTNINVSAPLEMKVDVEKRTIACFDNTTITVTVTKKEAGKAVDFSIDGGTTWVSPPSDSHVFTVVAGNYLPTIRYQDNSDCEIYDDAILINNDVNLMVHVSVSPQTLDCAGDHATVAVHATGVLSTVMEFTLDGNEWITGSANHTGTDTYIFNDVGVGKYNKIAVRYADNPGCPKIGEPINITEPDPVELILISKIEASGCLGEIPGSATIRGMKGSGSYKYSMNGVDYHPMPQNPYTITDLFAGAHTISLKDSKNCDATGTIQLTIVNSDKLMFNITEENVNCFGDASGKITINITQGIAPFRVKITAPATIDKEDKPVPAYDREFIIASNVLTVPNLYARDYTIKVTGKTSHGKDCEEQQNMRITQTRLPLILTIEPTNICPNEEWGGYTPNTYGGVPGSGYYKYYWYTKDEMTNEFLVMYPDIITGEATEESPDTDRLKAGEYMVIVVDRLMCRDTTTFEVIKMDVYVDIVTHNASCDEGEGSIEIIKKYPQRNYVYEVRNQFDDSIVPDDMIQKGDDSDLIVGLKPGTYNMTVLDEKGTDCDPKIFNIVIDKENEINIIDIIEPRCDAPGRVYFEVSGNGNRTVTCNNGVVTEEADGTYSVELIKGGLTVIEVDDENGCINKWEDNIEYITSLEFESVEVKPNDCPQDRNGEIVAKVIDKDVDWENKYEYFIYRLYQGKTTVPENQIDEIIVEKENLNDAVTFAGLPNGWYALSMEADNGCFTEDASVEITSSGSDITIDIIQITDNLCNGYKNGFMSFTITGDPTINEYQWTVSDEQGVASATEGVGTVSISNLKAGIYTIDVVYGNCTASDYPLGEVKEGFSIDLEATPVHVHGCEDDANGAIEIEIITNEIGGPQYLYQYWTSGSSGFSNDDWEEMNGISITVNELVPGVYDVVAKNNVGCMTEIKSVEVIKEPVMTIAYNETVAIICKGEYGEVDIIISDGSGDYSVSLVPLEEGGYPSYAEPPVLTGMTLSNITGGLYKIAAIDNVTGCMDTLKLDVKAPKVIEIEATLDAPLCYTPGVQNAIVDVKVIHPESGTFNYYLNTLDDLLESSDQTEYTYILTTGNYRIIVGMEVDGNECLADTMFNIFIPKLMELDVVVTKSPDENCTYTAQMTINIEGGATPYTIQINGNTIQNTTVDIVKSGSYIIEVWDANGCFAYKTEDIILPDGIIIQELIHEPLCTYSSSGFIGLYPINYTYVWDDYGKGVVEFNQIGDLDAGTYSVTISDGPCSVRKEYVLIPAYDLSASVSFKDYPLEDIIEVCPYSDPIRVTGNVQGVKNIETLEVGDIVARWETYGGVESFFPERPEIVLKPNNGKIKIGAGVTVTDRRIPVRSETCTDTAYVSVLLSDVPIVKMEKRDGDSIYIPQHEIFTLFTEIIGDYLPENVVWSANPDYGYHDYGMLISPVDIAAPGENRPYMLKLTVENDIGCKGSDSIYISRAFDFFIPNAFTPNGDLVHDTWMFRNIEHYATYYNIEVAVFNRVGILVYSGKGYNNSTVVWDGSRNGQDLPIGTYYYVVRFIPKSNGKMLEFKGPVTIIR